MTDQQRKEPWVEHRSLGRRKADRKWPRHLRDFWMVCITGAVAFALNSQRDTNHQIVINQTANTKALCTLRTDKETQIASTKKFLKTHPRGIPGIPVETLRISLRDQQHIVNALSSLHCKV